MRNPKQYRMYSNPVLEFLATTGPVTTLIFHGAIIAIMIYQGLVRYTPEISLTRALVCITGGLIFWTLAEYLLHRFVFHFEGKGRVMQSVHYALHGYHHQHPNDVNRLFMPPLPASVIIAIFFGLFYLVAGHYAFLIMPGFQVGYLLYSFLHYGIHTRKAPNGFHSVWHYHMLHHYFDSTKGYGVSSTFWDWVFQSLPKKDIPK